MVARVENNTIMELIPKYAIPVEHWYGVDFAKKCTEVPDNVQQGWVFENGIWKEHTYDEKILTPMEQREISYNTETIITWQGKNITVTEAARLWTYYTSEGDTDTATELTHLIAQAKDAIRQKYPE